jgi:hypothetical protein
VSSDCTFKHRVEVPARGFAQPLSCVYCEPLVYGVPYLLTVTPATSARRDTVHVFVRGGVQELARYQARARAREPSEVDLS